MNDMNAMFFWNGTFHITYQDHINCPDDVNQANQSFGHVATTDLVHLTHLPPVLVDNITFDGRLGPWDGPGFICHGKPMIIYNSHATGPGFSHQTKTAAFPTDSHDPMLTNWYRKPLDPALAFIGAGTLPPPWLNPAKDGYLAVSVSSANKCLVWETKDPQCLDWAVVNSSWNFCPGNSPEMFALPPVCPTCGAKNAQRNITHVYKYTSGLVDGYVLGSYTTNTAGQPGFVRVVPEQLYELSKTSQFSDGRGAWGESMLDPHTGRRITVMWVPPGVNPAYTKPFSGFVPLWHTTTAMRDVTYDPRLKTLNFLPIAEYDKLRVGKVPICSAVSSSIAPGKAVHLGQARQADISVTFTIPPKSSSYQQFGVRVLSDNSSEYTSIYFETGDGSPSPSPSNEQYMPGTDLPGDDYKHFAVQYSDPHLCAVRRHGCSHSLVRG